MRKVYNCAKADNNCVVDFSQSFSVMHAVHMDNFESISMSEEIVHLKSHANCLHVQTELCAHILRLHTCADSHCMHTVYTG